MGKEILRTGRLILRELEDGDFPALCRMLQDREVMYAYEHAFSDKEAWDWLRRQQTRYETDGFGLWAVVEQSTGEMVGQCGITWQETGDGRRVPEVGYLLEKAAWHKGYAAEAARACRDYAFTVLGFPEVWSIIRDNNLPSQAVARRNGMEVRGTMVKHYYGMDMPHLLFSVRREDWARLGETAPLVRRMAASEVEQGLELAWSVFLQFEAPEYGEAGTEAFRAFLRDPEQTEQLSMWGVWKAEELAGMIALMGSHVTLFFVREKYQGQGMGKALFRWVAAAAEGALTVNSSPYAVEIYRRLGFRPTGPQQVSDGIRYTPMEWKQSQQERQEA